MIAYAVANAISKRNLNVTDGSNGYPDRRIAVSQAFISVEDNMGGERDVKVYYFNYKDYQNPENITVAVK
jgi:hypothetical protein